MSRFNQIRNSVLGFVIGDTVGVPFEFTSRADLLKEPATDMEGHGTHNQPIGTWSDDSSMMLIIMEWLIWIKGQDKKFTDLYKDDYIKLRDMWRDFLFKGYWTPHGECFDIGGQTRRALCESEIWGREALNPQGQGNGALMRVLPFGFINIKDGRLSYATERVMEKTCDITHGNVISNYYCSSYIFLLRMILSGYKHFNSNPQLPALDNGWVVTTISSVGWAISQYPENVTNEDRSINFKNVILSAINLGEDTDTVAAITGGLLGASFDGKDDLPQDWLSKIVKLDQIEDLIVRFYETFKLEIEGE